MTASPPNSPPATAEPDLSGTVLAGRYRVLEQLGAGGMGTVYLAQHTTLGKKVAIKVLGRKVAERADLVERFLREARSTSLISQQNVIEISDFGDTADGSVFFVMEHLEGEDLRTLLKREKRLPWPRVRHLIVQVCRALEAAHAAGVIHRDMKPDNCFRVTRGAETDFIKVLDFGIAKVQNDELGLTKTGMIFGTARYMSPEQACGHSSEPQVDVYAVGIIMYELLCGRVPFRGKNFAEVLTKQIYSAPKPPRARAPDAGIPAQAEAIVLKALQKDPALRFASMTEMIAAIEAVGTDAAAVAVVDEGLVQPDASAAMSYSGQSTSGASIGGASVSGSVSGSVSAPVRDGSREPPASLRALWLGLGGLVLALVAGLVGFMVFGERPPSEGEDASADELPVADPPADSPAAEPAPEPARPAAEAPELAKIHFETNVRARIVNASDGALRGYSDAEAGIEFPLSDQSVTLLLEADGYQTLEIEVIPNRADKSFSYELEPAERSKGSAKKKKRKNAKEQPVFEEEPSSDLKNPFNH